MDKRDQKQFLATLVAAFRSTQRYMQRNYAPGKALEKSAPPS